MFAYCNIPSSCNYRRIPKTTRSCIKNSMGQIFCSRGRPLENCRGRPVDFTGHPVNSTGRPLEFSRGRPVKFFIAFLNEIGNSKSFEANLQNSSGRPVGFLEDVQQILLDVP